MTETRAGQRRANGEGTIYARKDGRFEGAAYVLISDGAVRRQRVYVYTRRRRSTSSPRSSNSPRWNPPCRPRPSPWTATSPTGSNTSSSRPANPRPTRVTKEGIIRVHFGAHARPQAGQAPSLQANDVRLLGPAHVEDDRQRGGRQGGRDPTPGCLQQRHDRRPSAAPGSASGTRASRGRRSTHTPNASASASGNRRSCRSNNSTRAASVAPAGTAATRPTPDGAPGPVIATSACSSQSARHA